MTHMYSKFICFHLFKDYLYDYYNTIFTFKIQKYKLTCKTYSLVN